ncbi:MAG: polyprenyl diphosphate synthase, partial [Spirochaetota bacterium]
MADNLFIDPGALPVHTGIIMDGNGRWAKKRNLPRTAGHLEGLKVAKRIVKAASDLGMQYLTLYTFSTENWKRTGEEISFLMSLIGKHLKKEYDFYRENRIRIVHSGDMDDLPKNVREEIFSAVRDTSSYSGLTVNLAVNYGGRDEIIRAVNRWIKDFRNRDSFPDSITQAIFRAYLDCPNLPDADLIIRTGGDKRLSNFLIWKSAYAELYFSDKLWPDWDASD